MAMTIKDWNELKILDDLFPIEVGSINLDSYMRDWMPSDLFNFLQSIKFSLHAYSTFNNERRVSSYIRKRCKYGDIHAINSQWNELFYNQNNIYVPSNNTYQLIFKDFSYYYLNKWQKIKAALEEEYGILKPYDMSTIEHEDNKLITSSDGTQTHAYTDTDNVTKDDENSEDRIYGFNSTEDGGVKSDSNTTKHQMTSNGSDSGTKTNKLDYNSDRDLDRTVTRKGNTGNITSQEMIEREIKLREYIIAKVIYKDLNEYLTLMVY